MGRLGEKDFLAAGALADRLGAGVGGRSDVGNWMFMGRPSRGTLLYCFIAFTASPRRSKITWAVPAWE